MSLLMAVNWGGLKYLMNFGQAINIDYVQANGKENFLKSQV